MGSQSHKLVAVLMAGIASLVMAHPVVAQSATEPSAGGDGASDRPQVVSPYWNQPREPMAGPGGIPTPQTPDELLGATVMAVPHAKAGEVVTKMQYRRSLSDLNRVTDNLRSDFRNSEEYTSAVNDLRDAHAAYDRARSAAVNDLRESDDYQSALTLHGDASRQIADEKLQNRPDAERLLALAELKLDYIAPLRSVERDAMESNGDVRNARENLRRAADRVSRLERDFARDARDSITLTDLRRQQSDAQIAMVASGAFLEEMRSARSLAIEYAVFSRRNARYVPYGGDYSLGYGYGYPYGSYIGGGYVGGGFVGGTIGNVGVGVTSVQRGPGFGAFGAGPTVTGTGGDLRGGSTGQFGVGGRTGR